MPSDENTDALFSPMDVLTADEFKQYLSHLLGASYDSATGPTYIPPTEQPQSPIEWRMYWALRAVFARQLLARADGFSVAFALEPQVRLGRYRVDFLLTVQRGAAIAHIVIECDGHDYHERTKGQAQNDKQRDRDLIAMGCTVLHFTGSELHQNLMGCARQAFEIVYGGSLNWDYTSNSAAVNILPGIDEWLDCCVGQPGHNEVIVGGDGSSTG